MNTKQQIIASARDLFWRRGFNATSVDDILASAHAGSGSLYYFFKGKEELLEEVLRSYLELLHPVVIEPALAKSDDPIEQVFGVLDGYREGLLARDFEFACPIGRLALEVPDASERVRSLLAENFRQWCDAIETCLEAAGDRLPGSLDRKGLARFVLTVMEGAVMQAATARSVQPFDVSVAHLRSYLAALVEAGSHPSPASGRPQEQEEGTGNETHPSA